MLTDDGLEKIVRRALVRLQLLVLLCLVVRGGCAIEWRVSVNWIERQSARKRAVLASLDIYTYVRGLMVVCQAVYRGYVAKRPERTVGTHFPPAFSWLSLQKLCVFSGVKFNAVAIPD